MAASEAHLLARLLAAGLQHSDAVTDGRSYSTKHHARGRQRAFLYALRRSDLNGIYTHVRQASDGRWRVYATRIRIYPAEGALGAGEGSSHRSSARLQSSSQAPG
jgi:hypothetical protein